MLANKFMSALKLLAIDKIIIHDCLSNRPTRTNPGELTGLAGRLFFCLSHSLFPNKDLNSLVLFCFVLFCFFFLFFWKLYLKLAQSTK